MRLLFTSFVLAVLIASSLAYGQRAIYLNAPATGMAQNDLVDSLANYGLTASIDTTVVTKGVRALDGRGLTLFEDGGLGITIHDGSGIVSIQSKLHQEITLNGTPFGTQTGIDIIIEAEAQNATSEFHAIDVAVDTVSAGAVVALGTHSNVVVIHQHIGGLVEISSAWKFYDGTTDTLEVTTALATAVDDSSLFNSDDDEFIIGHTTKFDEIAVQLSTVASQPVIPEFFFMISDGSWVEFDPGDDTSGFTHDGSIRFNSGDLTDWSEQTNIKTVTGYWIKIVRTRNNIVTAPIESTIKVVVATEHLWSEFGGLAVKSTLQDTLYLGTALSSTGTANATYFADIGISQYDAVRISASDVANTEYARFTATGLESRTAAEVAQDIDANIVETGTVTAGTWASNVTLGLGESVDLGAPSALTNDTYVASSTITLIAGYTTAFGDIVYINEPGDDRLELADHDTEIKVGEVGLWVTLEASITDGNACKVMRSGLIEHDGWSFTVGATVFVGNSGGATTTIGDMAAGEWVRAIGTAIDATTMDFKPDHIYIEVP